MRERLVVSSELTKDDTPAKHDGSMDEAAPKTELPSNAFIRQALIDRDPSSEASSLINDPSLV